MNQKTLFYGLVIVQVLFLLGMIGLKQSTVLFGEKVLLKPEPLDPTDPFRGDYVMIRYEISTIALAPGQNAEFLPGEKVYVSLRKGEEYWNVSSLGRKRGTFPYLKGTVRSVSQKVAYAIADENTSQEYTYESYEFGYGTLFKSERGLDVGDRVEFSVLNGAVGYAVPCDEECPSDQYPIKTPRGSFEPELRRGTIASIRPGITELFIEYPIDTYFVPKGEGTRAELRDFERLLVEVSVWRGDAVITSILYNGKPLEFSIP